MPLSKRLIGLLRSRVVRVGASAGLILLAAWVAWVHPFLAITSRVDADILVVEGWVPNHVLVAAAEEFRGGSYRLILTSGLEFEPKTGHEHGASHASVAKDTIEGCGIDPVLVVACPAPPATWARTAAMARAVRGELAGLTVPPKGVNVVTAGPHARQTWVAYEHLCGDLAPIGIISVPKRDYDADRWWMSRRGLIWVPKDFLGWIKECLIGEQLVAAKPQTGSQDPDSKCVESPDA